MSAASKLVNEFRCKLTMPKQGKSSFTNSSAGHGHSRSRRKRRTFVAFCAALFAVSGTYFVAGTSIPGAIANDDDSAASFFRADRARQRLRRAVQRSSYIPVLSIFGRKNRHVGRDRNIGRSRDAGRGGTLNRNRFPGSDKQVARTRNTRHLIAKRSRKTARSKYRYARGTRSVCVRLCDGFHFPVGNLSRSSNIKAHEAICSGLCPGAPTRLYKFSRGKTDILEAVSVRTGKSYADLPVALRYTGKRDKTCSCKAASTPHMALVSLRRDFTLRKGDAVVTKRGIRIFKGARRWPYRARDFATIRRTRGLRRSARKRLYALEKASSKRSVLRQARKRMSQANRIASATPTLPAIGPMPTPRPRYLAGGFRAKYK